MADPKDTFVSRRNLTFIIKRDADGKAVRVSGGGFVADPDLVNDGLDHAMSEFARRDVAEKLRVETAKVTKVSRANARNGAMGGKQQGNLHARAKHYFAIEVDGFRMDNGGRWPTESEADALLKGNCEKHKLAKPGESTIKRWLTELGKPKVHKRR